MKKKYPIPHAFTRSMLTDLLPYKKVRLRSPGEQNRLFRETSNRLVLA